MRRLNADLETRVLHRTAELEASTRELDAFAYSVSHDLRAPLRSLHGFSDALLEDYGAVLDDEGKDYLRRLQHNVQRMGRMIDDLLNSREPPGPTSPATPSTSPPWPTTSSTSCAQLTPAGPSPCTSATL